MSINNSRHATLKINVISNLSNSTYMKFAVQICIITIYQHCIQLKHKTLRLGSIVTHVIIWVGRLNMYNGIRETKLPLKV